MKRVHLKWSFIVISKPVVFGDLNVETHLKLRKLASVTCCNLSVAESGRCWSVRGRTGVARKFFSRGRKESRGLPLSFSALSSFCLSLHLLFYTFFFPTPYRFLPPFLLVSLKSKTLEFHSSRESGGALHVISPSPAGYCEVEFRALPGIA